MMRGAIARSQSAPAGTSIEFADWYQGPAEWWFSAGAEAGVCEPNPEARGRGWRDCRRPSEALARSERSDGVLVHHFVDTVTRPYTLRARWCPSVGSTTETGSLAIRVHRPNVFAALTRFLSFDRGRRRSGVTGHLPRELRDAVDGSLHV